MSSAASNSSEQERENGGFVQGMIDWVADAGAVTLDVFAHVGDLTLFSLSTFRWLFTRLPRRDTLIPACYQVGVMSLPVVALTGMFIGMVMAVQISYQFSQWGMETMLGGIINMTLVRELGPVLAASMLAGRVGSAMAAELGTMRVTEQIDALDSMGANPILYLAVPRFLACVLLIPPLTVMADLMGVMGGYLYCAGIFKIDSSYYWYHSREFVGAWDFLSGVFKSIFFGAAIGLVSCHRGFRCAPGAEGVGRAATAAFVYSFVLILLLDLLLGILIDATYYSIWPEGGGRMF